MIITFYSYKGGVGRSMALANVAEWLFRQGLRVIVVDWDLEAPGLENYFESSDSVLRTLCRGRGVVDLLVSYQSAHATLLPPCPGAEPSAVKPLSPGEKLKVVNDLLPSVAFSLQPLEGSARPSIEGKEAGIWLLSAGARGEHFAQYADHVHSFDWSAFYLKQDGDIFFRWLRAELQNFADVILVDSRTGVTEMSGVCTRDLADLVVSFCAPNDSNLDGVVRMTRWFLDRELAALRTGRPLRAMIVPSRIDGKSETAELAKFKDKFFEQVSGLKDLDPQVDAEAWWQLQIGYVSYYSFRESIVLGPRASESRRVYSEYLQQDLARLAIDLAKRYLAHAANLGISFSGRKLERPLEGLLTEGVAPSALAEDAFARIPPQQQARAMSVLARLVKVARADEGGAIAAIRVPVAVLEAIDPALVEQLVEARLIRRSDDESGRPCVELRDSVYAHEWPRLRQFVSADAEFIRWRQQLDAYLNAFRSHGNAPDLLLAGELLSEAARWDGARHEDLSRDEQDFIFQSKLRADALAQQTVFVVRAANSRRKISIVAAGLVAMLLTALGLYSTFKERAQQRDVAAIAVLQRAADDALSRDDYLGALGKLDEALLRSPQNAVLLLKRGSAKVTASRLPGRDSLLDEAISDIDASIKLDRQQPQAFRVRADALQRRKGPQDLESADADLTQAITLDPADTANVLERAKLRESRGLIRPALQDYTKALELDPASADAHYARGLLFVSANEPDQASLDFRKVVELGGDPALVEVASAQLQRLGRSQLPTRKPRVLMHFSYQPDEVLVSLVVKNLAAEFEIATPALTTVRTDGDVRYFYREDRSVATRLSTLLHAALATRGVRRQFEVIYVDSKLFPSTAQRGQLEAWLPPLTQSTRSSSVGLSTRSVDLSTMKVDVFWCTSGGSFARTQAQTLVDKRNPQWQERWESKELSESDNARPGFRVSGYQVRVSSDAEAAAGEELRSWAAKMLDTRVTTMRAERYDTPNYLSVFICPSQAAAK